MHQKNGWPKELYYGIKESDDGRFASDDEVNKDLPKIYDGLVEMYKAKFEFCQEEIKNKDILNQIQSTKKFKCSAKN